MNRRAFLKEAALSAVALRMGAMTIGSARAATSAAPEIPALAIPLLNLVNSERAAAGVASLKLDPLACTVATKHATEMARNDFLSHWGLVGRKPYHRYSFAGGFEAVHENGGSINSNAPIAPDEIPVYLNMMHKAMYEETPPDDGHRQTILRPWHTHVGFGYADYGLTVRLCELYVARYLAIDPYAPKAAPGTEFLLSGRLLENKHSIEAVDVYYEPLPSPPELAWLRELRPYGLPDDRETLMPKLRPNYVYEDGSKGTVELLGRGRFRVPVLLSRRQPGIYTVVVWIQRSPTEAPFPATHVCVRAE